MAVKVRIVSLSQVSVLSVVANFVTIRDNYFIRRGDDFSLGILGESNALYIILVIVLTKAAPAFFVKCLFFSPFFRLFNRFGYLNQSGKFHMKIANFHYTQCIQ